MTRDPIDYLYLAGVVAFGVVMLSFAGSCAAGAYYLWRVVLP